MNKFKKYILQYQSNNEINYLIYHLTDNIVTELWSNVVYEHYESGNNNFYGKELDINAYDSDDSVKQIHWKVIVDNCNYLDSVDYPGKDIFNLSHEIEVNTNLLNLLHKKFHYISEKFYSMTANGDEKYDFDVISSKLMELNNSIHKIENCDFIKDASGGYVNITLNHNHKHLILINDEIRKTLWHDPLLKIKPGDLWLAYGTIGKTLWDCYKDNDTTLIRELGVRPKMTISSSHSISFGARIPDNLELKYLTVSQWLRKNNLERYINPNEPQHYYSAEPLLAQLENDITPDDIHNIFLKNKFIKFIIE
jgi:hypothetical protein